MDFEWDEEKAATNLKKHGVRFAEAASVFLDINALEVFDAESSVDEDRWVRIGRSERLKVLVVVYCEKFSPERIRIISARLATKSEEKQYCLKRFL
ncbi:BrnT family toxin [Bdellovibrio bacteriovorus]|uniref:BrnT family toxin n=1 Tax=Bdellovibrio TaxID=958 RepID=UPI0035A961EB